MNISRRNFLKSGSLAFSALGLNMASPEMFQRKLMAAPGMANKKMIFIFQQGGNDPGHGMGFMSARDLEVALGLTT